MRNKPFDDLRWYRGGWAVLTGLGVMLAFALSSDVPWSFAQSQQQQQQEEKTEEIPKPPKEDFTVSVYKSLDEKKAEKLTFKDKYKADKAEEPVEIVVTYYNWSVSPEDYWNRQINIETKNKEGFVIEKINKSGFGDLGYVKPGDKKTLDSFKKEKITVSGNTATATMVDMEIGKAENDRYHSLMEKFVLKK
ncbi:MAG TPA: hypothetical protein VMW38_22485 [Terriglobia bacterium]|nr:hypothetical protein [Terriglobia bacterium]